MREKIMQYSADVNLVSSVVSRLAAAHVRRPAHALRARQSCDLT